MNSSGQMAYILRFLRFLKNSHTRYSVHSPFIYELIMRTMRPCKSPQGSAQVEALRSRLMNDHQSILKTDFGTGGLGEAGQYRVKISEIARGSLSSKRKIRKIVFLAKFMQARNMLEIGTSLGITAAYLQLIDPEISLFTLEGCPETARLARENLSSIGLDQVQIVEGAFEQSLPKVLLDIKRLDLVFFDGNHRKGGTLDYFYRCLEHAHNDSVFIIDDIHWSEEMEEAWEEIKKHEKVTVSIDLFHMGWVFFRKESSRQDFILRYL